MCIRDSCGVDWNGFRPNTPSRTAAYGWSRTTGSDGSVGITMNDDSLLSAGSNSRLALDRFVHDPSTNQGRFNVSLNRGTLAVISGRIAKQSPDAMTVRTPAAILGVRGTEFAVKVGD